VDLLPKLASASPAKIDSRLDWSAPGLVIRVQFHIWIMLPAGCPYYSIGLLFNNRMLLWIHTYIHSFIHSLFIIASDQRSVSQ